ncbi:MAG: NADH-quinone oxidoreductase subunit J, partial [Anaerolineae bacterium]|nr:NADH-quinone oxidoreductase subunit J [Anaerolineae bacterium]
GDMLFTDYLLPFEATSILLLVAMVGAIVLTVKKKKGEQN